MAAMLLGLGAAGPWAGAWAQPSPSAETEAGRSADREPGAPANEAREADEPVSRPLTLAEVQAWTGRHPRLLFSSDDVAGLRARRDKPPYDMICRRLLVLADRHLEIAPDDVAKPRYQGRDQMSHILQRLAFVGLLTGDSKYTRKAIDLLLALGERGFPFHGTGEDGAGDLLIGLALTYDWTYHAMSAAERSQFRQQVTQLAIALNRLMADDGGLYGRLARRRGAAGHHVVALASGGLGLVSLALRGEANREFTNTWQLAGDLGVRSYLRDAFGADGAGIEGFELSTYGLHAALPYLVARRRMDKEDLTQGTAVAQAASWYVYELLPGPAMLPLGDSGRTLGAEDAMAAMFAAVPGDPVHAAVYEATHGSGGRKMFGTADETFCAGDVMTYLWYPGEPAAFDPAGRLPLGRQFPSRGMAYVRSGWGAEAGDVVASFHCPSRAHLGRWQQDVNQFTLYAYKAGWAIDSGHGWQMRGRDSSLTPSGGSQGHNLMQIDGRDAAKPFGRMLVFMDEKDWALAAGDGAAAFGVPMFRRFFAVGKRDGRARYVVVIDEVDPGGEAGAEHEVVHFLHTGAGNTVDVAGQVARITAPDGAVGQFAVISPRGAALRVADFEVMDGTKHPRVEVSHKPVGKFLYVAVLVPRAAGDERPVVIRPVFDAEGAVAARVTVDGVEDRICVLADTGARPPEGFGRQRHRIQLTNGAFSKSLLFDLEEPGHDVPGPDGPTPVPVP